METKNYFLTLFEKNVNDKIEKKNGLSYLSWAFAWAEIKKEHPNANYIIYENANGWNYHTDGKTCWVKTGVIINGIEHIEYLPVMSLRNVSIGAESVTSMDVNKAIQRSLTKACARHGLGLYIYAGEDLPNSETNEFLKPTTEQLDEAKELNIDLKNLAIYLKCSVDKISSKMLATAIKMKRDALDKKAKNESNV